MSTTLSSDSVPSPATPENGNRHIPGTAALLAKKEDLYGFDERDAASRNKRLALDWRKYIIGPRRVPTFIDQYLPSTNKPGMPSPKDAFNSILESPVDEKSLYKLFVQAINEDGERPSRSPGFIWVDTSTQSENSGTGSYKPDICCFAVNAVEKAVSNTKEPKICAHMGYAEMCGEAKKTFAQDFLQDPDPDPAVERCRFFKNLPDDNSQEAQRREEALGQNISYAAEAFARQHRDFYFTLSLSGNRLRFIRWDRAGAVASESFSLHDNPEYLCEFLWRFSHASPAERGFDPSVAFPEAGDEERFRTAIEKRVALELDLDLNDESEQVQAQLKEAVSFHYHVGHVTVLLVVDAAGNQERFLVSRPIVSPLSVATRGTRGYWAVDEHGRVVFIKDTWRYSLLGQEGAILAELKDRGVVNTPGVRIHGDVMRGTGTSTTQTDRCVGEDWVSSSGLASETVVILQHTHYRLVLNTVGYTLKEFKDSQELLSATFDAYEALRSAYEQDKRLHRDISIENIILVRDPATKKRMGMLIDWEFSTVIDSKAHEYNLARTGTWLFMSAKLLSPSRQPHNIQDDMESFIYVVLYCALRWLPAQISKPTTLSNIFSGLFEQCLHVRSQGIITGGDGKGANIFDQTYTAQITFDCGPLQHWMDTAISYLRPATRTTAVGPRWDHPRHLAEFWQDLLADNSDGLVGHGSGRVTNKLANVHPSDGKPIAGTMTSKFVVEASHTSHTNLQPDDGRSHVRQGKRKAVEESELGPSSVPKRRHLNEAPVGSGDGAGPSRLVSGPGSPLRRSAFQQGSSGRVQPGSGGSVRGSEASVTGSGAPLAVPLQPGSDDGTGVEDGASEAGQRRGRSSTGRGRGRGRARAGSAVGRGAADRGRSRGSRIGTRSRGAAGRGRGARAGGGSHGEGLGRGVTAAGGASGSKESRVYRRGRSAGLAGKT